MLPCSSPQALAINPAVGSSLVICVRRLLDSRSGDPEFAGPGHAGNCYNKPQQSVRARTRGWFWRKQSPVHQGSTSRTRTGVFHMVVEEPVLATPISSPQHTPGQQTPGWKPCTHGPIAGMITKNRGPLLRHGKVSHQKKDKRHQSSSKTLTKGQLCKQTFPKTGSRSFWEPLTGLTGIFMPPQTKQSPRVSPS